MELTTNNRSFIGSGINQAITSKISLAFSFVEYFVIAFGHVAIYRQFSFQPQGRLLVLFYVNIIACFIAGIIALTPLLLNFVINVDLILFQWVRIIPSLVEHIDSNIIRRHTLSQPACSCFASWRLITREKELRPLLLALPGTRGSQVIQT